MDKIDKVLEKFGLSVNETKIYRKALELEETSPYELSKLTRIPRTTVYDVITGLSLKGLIELKQSDGFTKQQTRIIAKNPSDLRKIVRHKQEDLVDLEVDIVDILPDLKKKFQKKESNANFEFFDGIDGAKHVYFNEAKLGISENTYVFDNLMPMDAFGINEVNENLDSDNEIYASYNKVVKELIQINDWSRHVLTYQYQRNNDYLSYRSYRYLDNPLFNINQRIAISGSRIFVTCVKENESWGLIINSKALSKTFESIFHILWYQADQVTENLITSWGDNAFLKSQLKKNSKMSD